MNILFFITGIFAITLLIVIMFANKNSKTHVTSIMLYSTIYLVLATITIIMLSVENHKLKLHPNQIVFIWNDDEESIPVDGSLITLEHTDENTVYIGPYDKSAKTE